MNARNSSSELPPHVVIKDGKWHVRRLFPTKGRDARGRIVYLQITRRCQPETAEAAAALSDAIEAAYLAELTQKARPATLDDFLTRFLAAKDGSVERRTHEYYKAIFERYIEGSAFGSLPLVEIRLMDDDRETDVQRFYSDLKQNGASVDAVRRVHSFLSIAFNQAVAWGSLTKNPVKGAVIPKGRPLEVTFFDQAEARRFVHATYRSDDYIVLHFALETGMRPGEYLALAWDAVDLDRCIVYVRRAVSSGLKGGGFVMKDPKTNESRRAVKISEQLRDRLLVQRKVVDDAIAAAEKRRREPLLLDHMKKRGANYEKRRIRRQAAVETLANHAEYNLVFPAANGAPMSRLNLNKRELKEVLRFAKLDTGDYSLYSLRHTTATLLLASGVDIRTIAERLGHADATMCLKTYVHVLPSMRENANERLAAALY